MAPKATIFKAELTVSDLDRGHFATHQLTLARHPSETDERMMVRLLAFALHADERLAFGPGLSTEDEPDLALADLTGATELWIEVGLPDERQVRRACSRARRVVVYAFGSAAGVWWGQQGEALARFENLAVVALPPESTRQLAARAGRTMSLQCTVQEGHIWWSDEAVSLEIAPTVLKPAAAS